MTTPATISKSFRPPWTSSSILSLAEKSPYFPKTGPSRFTHPYTQFVIACLPLAEVVREMYGVPEAVTITQAIIESKSKNSDYPGSSYLARAANNFFGIKAYGWDGPTVVSKTGEHVKGRNVMITAKFRAYPDAVHSFNDYGHFLSTNSNYRAAFSKKTPLAFGLAVIAGSYGTGASYRDTFAQIIPATIARIEAAKKFYASLKAAA